MQHMEECPEVLSCDLVLFHLVNLVVPIYLRNFDKGCYWQAASMPDPAEHIAHSTCSPMQVLLQDLQYNMFGKTCLSMTCTTRPGTLH
jgi:hypothetical protein